MSDINKIKIFDNKIFEDDRGSVRHFFKNTSISMNIEEVYFSSVKKNVVKGWKFHSNKNQFLTCIIGEIQFFIGEKDDNGNIILVDRFNLFSKKNKALYIPSNTWYAFKGISNSDAVLVNAVDKEHSKCLSKNCIFDESVI